MGTGHRHWWNRKNGGTGHSVKESSSRREPGGELCVGFRPPLGMKCPVGLAGVLESSGGGQSAWRTAPWSESQLCPASQQPWGCDLSSQNGGNRTGTPSQVLCLPITVCIGLWDSFTQTWPKGPSLFLVHLLLKSLPSLNSLSEPPMTRSPIHVPIAPARSLQTFTIVNILTYMVIWLSVPQPHGKL